MVIARDRPLLYFVHSTGAEAGEARHAARALAAAGGDAWDAVDIVQVRGKDLPAGDLETLARVWIAALEEHSTLVVVNDRLDVALAAGADGVHLGRNDLPVDEARSTTPEGFVIGATAHGAAEIARAQAAGADYAGLGAFFPTDTKAGATVLDPAGLRSPAPTIPVVAIGGITAQRVAEVLAIPLVTGVAVSAALQAAPEPAEAIRELRSALDRAWRERAPGMPAGAR